MTSDLTSLFSSLSISATTASSSSSTTSALRFLSEEEVRTTRPNTRIAWITPDQTPFDFEFDIPVFCDNDELHINESRACTVTNYEGEWYQIRWSKTKKRFALHTPRPDIDAWNTDPNDLDDTYKEKHDSSDDEDEIPLVDPIDEQIRAAPIPIELHSPQTMTTTMTQNPPTQTTTTVATTAPPAATPAAPVNVQQAFDQALRRVPGGGTPGGGPPAGPPAGPPGPPGPGPPALPPNAALQPVAVVGDVKMMGQPPPIFSGDRTKADHFVDQVQGYLRLNRDVTGFNSPMKKMAFMLSHIQGEETNAWTREMGNLLDRLDPIADNVPVLWDQFLLEFRTQYQDTQRENRARAQIETHRMRFPDIDQYISSFEELARVAGYTQGDEATTHYFVKGLTPSIMVEVYKPPAPRTYEDIKQRAIDSTRSRMLIDDILGKRAGPGRGRGQPPRFPTFGRQPPRPFFQQQRQQQQPYQAPGQSYNSSNAPRWMNNNPVPMDVGRTRAPTYRGRGNAFGRAAPQTRNPITCFQCGKEGHFARNCAQRRNGFDNRRPYTSNYIDYDDNPVSAEPQSIPTEDRIARLKAELEAMTLEDKEQLATEMGQTEDFPSA